MEVDRTLLKLFLQYAATEGASLGASWLLERVKIFQKLSSEVKLYVSYAVTGLIGLAAFFAMMGLLYIEPPVGYVAWIETLFGVALFAIFGPQIAHRLSSLRRKDRIVAALEECCEDSCCEDCCG